MKVKLALILGVLLLLLLLASGASARPLGCTVMLPVTERDATVTVINDLMGAAMRTGDYMVDLALLQEAQRVMQTLEAAPGIGCETVRKTR